MLNSLSASTSILITGGAGYIGSHLTRLLHELNYSVVVFDDLSTGHAWAVEDVPLVQGDILDESALRDCLQTYQVTAVIHLAAKSSVPESFQDPERYFRVNVDGTKHVVQACVDAGVKQLIFSSTAAVYGNATQGLVDENALVSPISPYGESKMLGEQWIQEQCEHNHIQYAIFRFFNVLGAHPTGDLGQLNPHSNHLFKQCVRSVQGYQQLKIFGCDYPTEDGTAERDYIHVQDLADLHVQVLRHFTNSYESMLLNAGYGLAHSVLSFVQMFEQVTQMDTHYQLSNRRFGDPVSLISDVSKLKVLNIWQPQYASLQTMIRNAWAWECSEKRRLM